MVEFFCEQNFAKFISTPYISKRSYSIHLKIAQKSLFTFSLLTVFLGFLGEIINCHFKAFFFISVVNSPPNFDLSSSL